MASYCYALVVGIILLVYLLVLVTREWPTPVTVGSDLEHITYREYLEIAQFDPVCSCENTFISRDICTNVSFTADDWMEGMHAAHVMYEETEPSPGE